MSAPSPRFSVIMPAYNAAPYLRTTVESVLAQTWTDWELIIVDDGSTDRTPEIAAEFAQRDPRIRLLRQPNGRQAAARNHGMRTARGQCFAFLDADDLWLPEKLQVQEAFLTAHPHVDVLFSDGYSYWEDNKVRTPYHYPVGKGLLPGREFYPSQIFGNHVPILSVAMRREWVDRVGMQDEDRQKSGCEDHDYWLRLMRAGANFFGLDRPLFIYRVHPDSYSSNQLRQIYGTALVRLKNFEGELLSPAERQRFSRDMQWFARTLDSSRRRDWGGDIRHKTAGLRLPTSGRDRLVDYRRRARTLFLGKPRHALVSLFWRVARRIHFIVRRRLTVLNRRLYSDYVNRLWSKQLVRPGSIFIDPTAKIDFSFPSGRINAVRLSVGDCSRINLMKEGSELITGDNVLIARFCNFNVLGRVILGNNVLFNNYCSVNCFEEITIGDDSWFGEGVRFYDHNHRYKDNELPFTVQGYTTGKVIVGRNVWVGSNTVILPNVTIGDGCVIGANNLIFKSIPPNTIVKARAMGQAEPILRRRSGPADGASAGPGADGASLPFAGPADSEKLPS